MSLVYELTLVYIHQSLAGGQLCYISHTDQYETNSYLHRKHLSLLLRVYTYNIPYIMTRISILFLRYEHDAPAT